MIEVRGVSKKYQDKIVLNNINIKIPKGGITSIVGANGAGKSTLLSLIGRLLPMDEGQILVNGLDITITDSNTLAKNISILRQENHFVSRLMVRELVSFGRYPYSKGHLNQNDLQKIDDSLSFLGLTDLQNRFLDELSGGQRQRAYVAMVLCQDTEYVLLDEPLNNLDMKHSVNMMKQIHRAAIEMNKTIVIIIHDINFASVYSDRIIAMRNGQVIHQGEPGEIMQEDILEDIFDTPILVKDLAGQKLGIYY